MVGELHGVELGGSKEAERTLSVISSNFIEPIYIIFDWQMQCLEVAIATRGDSSSRRKLNMWIKSTMNASCGVNQGSQWYRITDPFAEEC